MKTFELEGKGREIVARSADQKRALKAMRKNNEIPAVLYGGEKVTHFTITTDSVRKLVYSPEDMVLHYLKFGTSLHGFLLPQDHQLHNRPNPF